MTQLAERIVAASDAGKHPGEIAVALDVSQSIVYRVLRAERPQRKRKPRACTSDLPARIKALHAAGVKPGRIAVLQRCSRAYVYRHI